MSDPPLAVLGAAYSVDAGFQTEGMGQPQVTLLIGSGAVPDHRGVLVNPVKHGRMADFDHFSADFDHFSADFDKVLADFDKVLADFGDSLADSGDRLEGTVGAWGNDGRVDRDM